MVKVMVQSMVKVMVHLMATLHGTWAFVGTTGKRAQGQELLNELSLYAFAAHLTHD
jgi:hypothetical protein